MSTIHERVVEVFEARTRTVGAFLNAPAGHMVSDEDRYILAVLRAVPEVRRALAACEENLRLIHEAAGPVPKSAPMPSHSTFEAWTAARAALALLPDMEVSDAR